MPSENAQHPLKIAIASSGLGHISRGIETWAADTGLGLHSAGQDVALFQGGGTTGAEWQQVLPCKRRFDTDTQRWVQRLQRLGGWRYGCGSGYQLEQTTFTRHLWARVRRDFDILHVQDPWIALLMEHLHRVGLSRPRVILAHGTEEPDRFLQKMSFLQHLAPCYLPPESAGKTARQSVFAIPNFVNVTRFQPGDRQAARALWALPQDAVIVLCVAAIKKEHKRVDSLIREFAAFTARFEPTAMLVIAGAREAGTDEVMELGASLLGTRVRFLEGIDRNDMPRLYQAADIFALASLHEMMPIAMLEALASGLPIACNDTPTMRWMAGPAGDLNDISQEGALADQLLRLTDPETRACYSQNARAHAEQTFSETIVIQQMLGMYQEVMAAKR